MDKLGESYVSSEVIKDVTRQFKTGATKDADNSKLDFEGFISPLVERRFAEYMYQCRLRNVPEGQTIRSSDNWQKGIPLDAYAKSLVRHVNEFRLIHDGFPARDEKGYDLSLEDVLCAIRFNVDGYLFELLKERYGRSNPGCRPMSPMSDSQSLDTEVKTVQHMLQDSAKDTRSDWHNRHGHYCACSTRKND